MGNGYRIGFWVDLDKSIADDLWSTLRVIDFLEQLVVAIRMVSIPHPYNPMTVKVDDGVSGFLLIETSHIAIHTTPGKCHALIEITSCRDFDPEFAARWSAHWWHGTCQIEHVGPLSRQLLLEAPCVSS